MDNSRRWSLFVDPQVQAANWIRKMEKKNNLEVLKFSFPDYMKRLEYCIPLGYPVLIENIEEILEAPLDPLLYKQTFKQGGGLLIQLGENVIEYHKNFKLYLTSKMRNPHYLPEIFNKVTIINFALTLTGLQDQLLGKYCDPDLPVAPLLRYFCSTSIFVIIDRPVSVPYYHHHLN